jgi:hypothetical protein
MKGISSAHCAFLGFLETYPIWCALFSKFLTPFRAQAEAPVFWPKSACRDDLFALLNYARGWVSDKAIDLSLDPCNSLVLLE